MVLAYLAGWRLLRILPARAAYAIFDLVADRVTARDGGSVQTLRENYRRVRPDLTGAALQDEVREGVRASFRNYCETFRLPAMSGAHIDSHAWLVGDGVAGLRAELDQGRPVLAFLGHTGNWDLAGAWCARHLGHVVSVAERLQPEEMFEAFLDFRQRELDMTIHPASHGTMGLLRAQLATGEPVVMPLLADRDLSARGVEVDLCGHRARMAPGPAALAVETGVPLFPVFMRHRRTPDGAWGLEITIEPRVPVPTEVPASERREAITTVTQACADALGTFVAAEPRHWHMMQKVFLADLDPERVARQRAVAAEQETP